MAEGWADYYGMSGALPTVDVVRYVLPEEVGQAQDDCLRVAGFQVDGPGMLFYPPEQEDSADLAQFTCRMQYPVFEKYTQEWGPAQIDIQYAWTAEFVIPCLEGQGHPIEGMPSKAVFVDSWATEPFFPFAQIRLDLPTDEYRTEWARLEATCAQIAPSGVLWDSMTIDEWKASH